MRESTDTIGYLEQEPQLDEKMTVLDIVKEGAGEEGGDGAKGDSTNEKKDDSEKK